MTLLHMHTFKFCSAAAELLACYLCCQSRERCGFAFIWLIEAFRECSAFMSTGGKTCSLNQAQGDWVNAELLPIITDC